MIKFSQKFKLENDFLNNNFIVCQVSLANNIPIIKDNYKNFTKIYRNLLFFIICPKNELRVFKKNFSQKNIKIINEDSLLKFKKFEKIYNNFSRNHKNKKEFKIRIKWYYQQILKISFLLTNPYCKKNNVVLWDADTIILKKINFFKSLKKSINYANVFEYHHPYFICAKKIVKVKIPDNYLSSVNQFISLTTFELKALKKIFLSPQQKINMPYTIAKKVLITIFNPKLKFNYSMFSEYETISLFKIKKDHPSFQKILFFIRYKLSGKLTRVQLFFCKMFNCVHITYEEYSQNGSNKKILNKNQKYFSFFKILFKNFSKFFLRKFKYKILNFFN
jgi:hypothetical protein